MIRFCKTTFKAHSHQARLRRYRTHGKRPARSTPSAFTSVDGRKRAQNRARFDFERVYVRRRTSTDVNALGVERAGLFPCVPYRRRRASTSVYVRRRASTRVDRRRRT